jgi:FkbM family methyltransferase
MTDWIFLFKKRILGTNGGWRSRPELEVKRTLKGMKGSLFIDIGANDGAYSSLLAKQFTKVYAFEPNPKALPELKRKSSATKNISIFEKALSNKNGRATLHSHPLSDRLGKSDTIISQQSSQTNGVQGSSNSQIGMKGVLVDTVTYDSIIREKADLVKIDVEGAEFLVLEGMENSLKNKQVDYIMIELHDMTKREMLQDLLSHYGLVCRWIDQSHLFATRITD